MLLFCKFRHPDIVLSSAVLQSTSGATPAQPTVSDSRTPKSRLGAATAEKRQQAQSRQGGSRGAGSRTESAGGRRKRGGGGLLEAVVRTAGIAGVLGAVVVQVMQHSRTR
jgi:hypothetical protein